MDNSYISASCNIGDSEIKKRKLLGIVGFLSALFLIIIITFACFPIYYVIISFPMIFLGFLGYLQSREKFCAYYGLLGVFNFKKDDKPTQITNNDFVKADKIKAIRIVVKSFIFSIILMIILLIFLYSTD